MKVHGSQIIVFVNGLQKGNNKRWDFLLYYFVHLVCDGYKIPQTINFLIYQQFNSICVIKGMSFTEKSAWIITSHDFGFQP